MSNPVIIIGAGPSGLACAATLKQLGIPSIVLEKEKVIAPVWRGHYDRLHLHTTKKFSGLPGLAMPQGFPNYPSRDDVISYFEAYANKFEIKPEFKTNVQSIVRKNGWEVITSKKTYTASEVVIGSGLGSFPHMPSWPGIDTFPGEIIHSSKYKNGTPFANQEVLVVGFGNSGGEIAMDLADHSAKPTICVRSPVNIVPRDILGIPILILSILQQWLPYKLADFLNWPILRLLIGDISKLGLKQSTKGPMAQIIEDGHIPLLDIGTLKQIREGKIRTSPGIKEFDGKTVRFDDGIEAEFDAIVLATGYRPNLRSMIPDCHEYLNDKGSPKTSGANSGGDGLYFCSFIASPTGQLRQIGIEARQIANSIQSRWARDEVLISSK